LSLQWSYRQNLETKITLKKKRKEKNRDRAQKIKITKKSEYEYVEIMKYSPYVWFVFNQNKPNLKTEKPKKKTTNLNS